MTANPVTCNPLYNTCAPGAQHVSTYTSYCPANVTPTGGATAARHRNARTRSRYSCGDQREQEDKRFVSGLRLTRTLTGRNLNTTAGIGLRNDNIYVLGLFLTNGQNRLPNGTLSNDQVVERDIYSYISTEYKAGPKLRLTGGLREDAYYMQVGDFQPANSGITTAAMINPKFTASYAASKNQEFYLDFGDSFHSNDARGTTQTLDPQTHANVDPSGAPVAELHAACTRVGRRIRLPLLRRRSSRRRSRSGSSTSPRSSCSTAITASRRRTARRCARVSN